MRAIKLKELLDGLSGHSRDSVERMLETVDVDYLVVFEAEEGVKPKRKMIAVGESLEYQELETVLSLKIPKMHVAYYADARIATSVSQFAEYLPPPKPKPKPKLVPAKAPSPKEPVAASPKEVETRVAEAAAPQAEVSSPELVRKQAELEQQLEALAAREEELNQMEEVMVSHMNEYMEKMAELEQREEDVARRERELSGDVD